MVAQIADAPSQNPSHHRQRGECWTRRSVGKVSVQARCPFAKVKLLAVASTAQVRNFQAMETLVPIATRAVTKKRAGKKDGKPELKIRSSNWASEKIVSAA